VTAPLGAFVPAVVDAPPAAAASELEVDTAPPAGVTPLEGCSTLLEVLLLPFVEVEEAASSVLVAFAFPALPPDELPASLEFFDFC